MPPTRTVGLPGNQSPQIEGMQGIGVRTPKAAAVAAATEGLANDVHIPNGKIFTNGALSLMVASGRLFNNIFAFGGTIIEVGAIPKEHFKIAP